MSSPDTIYNTVIISLCHIILFYITSYVICIHMSYAIYIYIYIYSIYTDVTRRAALRWRMVKSFGCELQGPAVRPGRYEDFLDCDTWDINIAILISVYWVDLT